MLEVEYNQEESCLSCGEKMQKTIKVKINREKQKDNIVSFCLCKKCMNKLAREFYPFS